MRERGACWVATIGARRRRLAEFASAAVTSAAPASSPVAISVISSSASSPGAKASGARETAETLCAGERHAPPAAPVSACSVEGVCETPSTDSAVLAPPLEGTAAVARRDERWLASVLN